MYFFYCTHTYAKPLKTVVCSGLQCVLSTKSEMVLFTVALGGTQLIFGLKGQQWLVCTKGW